MSKNSKTCKFIIKRGERKGKKCGKSCISNFCKSHNPKRLEYKKEYNDKVNKKYREEKQKEKLEGLFKITDINKLPSLDNLILKKNGLNGELLRFYKLKTGYLEVVYGNKSDEFQKFHKVLEKRSTKSCTDKLKDKKIDESIKPILVDDYDEVNNIKYKRHADNCECSACLTHQRNYCICDSCFELRHPEFSGKTIYFPFNGKKEIAKAKLKKIDRKIKLSKENIDQLNEKIKAVEKIISQIKI